MMCHFIFFSFILTVIERKSNTVSRMLACVNLYFYQTVLSFLNFNYFTDREALITVFPFVQVGKLMFFFFEHIETYLRGELSKMLSSSSDDSVENIYSKVSIEISLHCLSLCLLMSLFLLYSTF